MSQCRINARTIPRIALMRKWAALIVPSRVVLTAVVSRHVRMIRVKRLRTGVDAIWWTQTNNTGTQKIPRSWTQTKPGKVPHAWVAPRRLEKVAPRLNPCRKNTHAWKGQLPAQGIGTRANSLTNKQYINHILKTNCKEPQNFKDTSKTFELI